MLRASHFATDSALRASRGSNRRCIPVLADRARTPAGGRTKCAVRQGRTGSLADGGQTQDVSQDRSGILVGPPLTFLRQVQANRPPAGAGCIFVWSVGNRHRSSTRPPNIKADSAPHAYAQPIADSPETVARAGRSPCIVPTRRQKNRWLRSVAVMPKRSSLRSSLRCGPVLRPCSPYARQCAVIFKAAPFIGIPEGPSD